MSVAVQLPGATPILVGTGSANALQTLGYTMNGAEITAENFMEDVPGDQGGGEGGIPIEIQNFGQINRIHLVLTKVDPAVLALLESAVNTNGTLSTITAGKSVVPGSLMFSNSAYFRLLVNPPNISSLIRNYLIAIPREPKVLSPIGAKYLQVVMDWIAYPDLTQSPPLLWNATNT